MCVTYWGTGEWSIYEENGRIRFLLVFSFFFVRLGPLSHSSPADVLLTASLIPFPSEQANGQSPFLTKWGFNLS